jgi:hypothetical protein
MINLTHENVNNVLAEALFDHMLSVAGSRSEGCDAIGQVLLGTWGESPIAFIFKHEMNTPKWELTVVSPADYEPHTMIYYHENKGDAVTQAALHGDVLAPDSFEG